MIMIMYFCYSTSMWSNMDHHFTAPTNAATGATDIFVMLPGNEMNELNQNITQKTLDSVIALYPEEYLHIIYNTGDPTYFQKFPDEDQRKNHIVQQNKFALGGFAAAADWMEWNRPDGNFIILQHSTMLKGKRVEPPACDIELVNLSHRCGEPCRERDYDMLTSFGTSKCFLILNEMMTLYENYTCVFPCCPWNQQDAGGPKKRNFDYWPLMAHNTILFTPRARKFLQPLKNYIKAKPSYITKWEDQGTERLFGLYSAILLEMYGSLWDRNVSVGDTFYPNPFEAYMNKRFLCFQDLTLKHHGGVKSS